jgi:hypothetical protein
MHYDVFKPKIITVVVLILAGVWFVVCEPPVCLAKSKGSIVKDIPSPPAFNSPRPAFNSSRDDDSVVDEDRLYKTRGMLDAMNEEALVVNDKLYPLAPGAYIACTVGSYVGIKLNEYGKVVECKHFDPPEE